MDHKQVALGLAAGQTFAEWKDACLQAGVDLRVLEQWHSWKVRGELPVRLVRESNGLVLRVGESN
jgi:hypothetical protein